MMKYRTQLIRLFWIVLIFCISFPGTYSQNGIPFITFLDSREGFEANNWAVCQDDHNVMLFASRKGLLRYDGSNWQTVNVPHIPHKIKFNPFNKKVYILSEFNYGYLERDEKGNQYYEALTYENELDGGLSDIRFTDSTVIFFGERSISCHDITNHQLIYRYMADDYGKYSGTTATPKNTFVNIEGKGLFVVSEDTLLKASVTSWDSSKEIIFSLPYSSTKVLTGTSSGELLLFDGKSFTEYKLSNPDYLKENGLSGGLLLNDTLYVFSTSYGGVLIVKRESGKVIYTLNYESGLPDDEIYAIGKDKNEGIWLTYGFGTCRIDMNLKVKDYSHYPGIEGLYTNAIWYKNELYISTTEGLFYLSEVKNFEDVEIYLKQAPEIIEEKDSRRKKDRNSTVADTQEKKNLLSRLFTRKKKEGDPEETSPPQASVKTNPAPQVKYVRKKVSKLKSIEYVFKKAEGLNSRCEQLLATDYGILVGSSSGLYLVDDHKVKYISGIKNISFIAEENKSGNYQILSDEGVARLSFENGKPRINNNFIPLDNQLFSIWSSDSIYWISSYDMVYRIQMIRPDSINYREYNFKAVFPEELHLANVDNILFLFSESAIYYYAPESDSFLIYNSDKEALQKYSGLRFFPAVAGQQWLKLDQRMVRFDGDSDDFLDKKWGLFENITAFYSRKGSEFWIIDDYSRIYQIAKAYANDTTGNFDIFLESVTNEAGEYISLSNLEFEPSEKMVRIRVSAPFFLRNQTTEYQYKIVEKMGRWSNWNNNSSLDILLNPGEYTVLIRARNILGQTSKPLTVKILVHKPFYQSTWFYLGLIPFVLGFLYLIIYMREQKLRKDKRILEYKVEERTREIQKQKEKIEIQKDEILAQKNDITSSITYASRIQKAILPSKQAFEKTFSDYFIFYQPRDIVSGDFYWVYEQKEFIIFAVADCTGHGVPGAFMSMLGNSFLNQITKGEGATLSADMILNQLRDMINAALAQSGESVKAYDGMDISLCKYNLKSKELEFSGAYNSIYLVRQGILTEYKADRMPIGFYPKHRNFKSTTIQLLKNDVIYLFSDGFHDQFGGPFSKKYTTRQFKQILTALSPKSLQEQKSRLELELATWQGNNEQIDDILILGIRI